MDQQEVEKFIEQWCKAQGLNPAQCRTIAKRLAPIVMRDCDLAGPSKMLADARSGASFSPRFEAAERLRKCLEHYNVGEKRSLPRFDIQRFVGQVWGWITFDVLGKEHVRDTRPGHGGIRG